MPVRYLVITGLLRDKVFPMISKKNHLLTDPTYCSTVSRITNFFLALYERSMGTDQDFHVSADYLIKVILCYANLLQRKNNFPVR